VVNLAPQPQATEASTYSGWIDFFMARYSWLKALQLGVEKPAY